MITDEGVWIELDVASVQSYCHDQSGKAWCLVSSSDGDVFLRAQSEINDSVALCQLSPFATYTSSTAKGFDFTKASKTPTFSPFTVSALPGTLNCTSPLTQSVLHLTDFETQRRGSSDAVYHHHLEIYSAPITFAAIGAVQTSYEQQQTLTNVKSKGKIMGF